jgi:hypothetical protein
LSIFDTSEPSEDLIQAVADLAGAIADDLNN